MNNVINSARLYARPFANADRNYFFLLHKNQSTIKFMGKGFLSDEEIDVRFEKNLDHQQQYGYSAWAVFEKESNKFVGRCGLAKIGTLVKTDQDHSDKIEIGYAFLPEFWGSGYCQEIVPLFLSCGFKDFNLKEIFAKTAKDNLKSQHLLIKKFGFEYYCDVSVEDRDSLMFCLKNFY